MRTVVLFVLVLLRAGESNQSALAPHPAERPRSGHDTAGCSPSLRLPVVPDSIISPDGRLRVLLDVVNGGVDTLTMFDRRTGRLLFSRKYEITSFLWTGDSRLLLGVGPIYDRPRIVMISGKPVRERVLVRGSNRNKVSPAGADFFLVCSIGTDHGKPVLRYLRLPDVETVDYGNFPKFTKQNTVSIPER
jgi:hypothetical protein